MMMSYPTADWDWVHFKLWPAGGGAVPSVWYVVYTCDRCYMQYGGLMGSLEMAGQLAGCMGLFISVIDCGPMKKPRCSSACLGLFEMTGWLSGRLRATRSGLEIVTFFDSLVRTLRPPIYGAKTWLDQTNRSQIRHSWSNLWDEPIRRSANGIGRALTRS